ncbi:DUF1631 domain-containing protein [Chitiniphilus purpureus]|uniref:DUF1631 domain-containing protein n=1 Tax=Chitiniphilus purpureus TaxID=2981137 RepID=A0ABY6DL60_9NEIS|nr:DUF1631 domain-containing protein [Chitiniphilus sp. CD1]UXY15084.1 DUF1631 domain-containing protein [Chitiniphilus sp. CD1]
MMDRNDLLAQARTMFLQRFAELLAELIPLSEARLFKKAEFAGSMKESSQLFEARSVMLRHYETLRLDLVEQMEQLLNRSFQTAYSSFRPSFSSDGKALTLVNLAAIEDELRLDAITKYLRDEVEDQLRDLNIRVALLFGEQNVKERENPFRPYLLSRCISNTVEGLVDSREVASLLTDDLCEGLAGRICPIYEALNALFAQHGIAAQLQVKVRAAPWAHGFSGSAAPVDGPGETPPGDFVAAAPYSGGAGWPSGPEAREERLVHLVAAPEDDEDFAPAGSTAAAGWAGAAAATGSARGWLAGPQRAGTFLRKLFSGALPAGDAQARPEGPAAGLVQSLGQLQQAHAGIALSGDGRPRNWLLAHREALIEQARDDREQMTIDIVAMLFEFILRDTTVPAEVRAQLGRLQFTVLKLALQDASLLTSRNHPVRMLINRIGSISLGLKQIDPSGVRVAEEISRIVEALLARPDEGASSFTRMLDELDAFIASELRASEATVAPALDAVDRAQGRTLQFARIVAMTGAAIGEIRLDDYLHQFLHHDWPRAIEVAGRHDPSQALRFWRVVPELVWSVAPKITEDDRTQLRQILPGMVAVLREGLALAGRDDTRRTLLAWLLDAHQLAMRSTVVGQVPALAYFRERFEACLDEEAFVPSATLRAGRPRPDSQLLDEAIRELETRLDLMDRLFEDEPVDAEEDEMLLRQDDEVLAKLQRGVGVQINLGGKTVPAVLSWPDLARERLVLNLGGEAAPSIISLRLFLRLLHSDRACFIEDLPLFERAVSQLLQSADRLDQAH